MAHAIRLLVATPNASDQAQDKWADVARVRCGLTPEDRDQFVDALTTEAFPSIEWVAIDVHDCDHDRPDDTGGCGDWTRVYTRGNVPEAI